MLRPGEKVLSAQEVTDLLGVSMSEFDGLIDDGVFPPAIPISPKRSGWVKKDVDAYVYFQSRLWAPRKESKKKTAAKAVSAESLGRKERVLEFLDCMKKAEPIKFGGPVPDGMEAIYGQLVGNYNGPAVYFLLFGGAAIYVGSSISPMSRVRDHLLGTDKTPAKDFDRVAFLPVELQEMIERERTFITILRPPLNSNMNPNKDSEAATANKTQE